jgi:alpha-ketoglutarate-dependent taurine dioxygenase
MHILKSQQFSDEELLQYARSLSTKSGDIKEQLLHWDFGPLMTMVFDREAKNYLFSDEAVPLHWDGAFYKEPRFLLFYCTESEGEGGETLFVDTEKIWSELPPILKEASLKVKLIYRTEKLAHYGGEICVPLVQKHPETGKVILRIAEKVETKLNPVSLEIQGESWGLYEELVARCYSEKYQYAHRWEKGDLLVCDNFTYLHGRRELGNNKKRTFKRIQIL